MKIQKLTSRRIILGFRQFYFTFFQTVKLVWKANSSLMIGVFVVNILSGILIFPTLWLEKLTLDTLVKNIGNPYWQGVLKFLFFLLFLRVFLGIIQSGLLRLSGFLQFAVARVFSGYLDILLGEKMAQLDMETIDDPEFMDRFNKIERESGRRAWSLAWPLSSIPNYLFGLISTFSLIFFLILL